MTPILDRQIIKSPRLLVLLRGAPRSSPQPTPHSDIAHINPSDDDAVIALNLAARRGTRSRAPSVGTPKCEDSDV